MHLLKRFFLWWHKPCEHAELLNKTEYDHHCASDLGVRVSRIRLPSGAEVVLIDDIREPEPESRDTAPRVEAETFIHDETSP